jgi:hypothetical protein
MDENLYTNAPDFINDDGTKWWTFDAYRGIPTYFTELADGSRTYLALDNKEIAAESANVEGITLKIDLYVLLKDAKISNPGI